MPQHRVKKVVAVCFLEAVKMTLEHLGSHRLELSQKGAPACSDLTRLYGEVRRLRDYVQRCVSGFKEEVDLDFAAEDAALLVACCRRAVESIEARLTDKPVAADERQWLEKKTKVLADWAVEIAQKPLIDLKLPALAEGGKGEAARTLLTRLQHKLYGDVASRMKLMPSGSAATEGRVGTSVPAETAPAPAALPPLPPVDSEAAEPPSAATAATALFDANTLRDPRLRALGTVDLRSYERALANGDYRIATVLLASILESALLDHLIPRRAEFQLTGTPDAWIPQDLSLTVLGEHATPKDRSLAFHLFASRNLLRPALQMVTPAIVTVASFERLREFVERVLHRMGFGAASGAPGTAAAPAGHAAPEPAPAPAAD